MSRNLIEWEGWGLKACSWSEIDAELQAAELIGITIILKCGQSELIATISEHVQGSTYKVDYGDAKPTENIDLMLPSGVKWSWFWFLV